MNPTIQMLREFVADPDSGMSITLRQDEVASVMELIDLLTEELKDMVAQNCTMSDRTLDSCALSSHAGSMRLLADLGKIEITHDQGRRVLGRWKSLDSPVKSANS
jgi:hypothetical protein